MGLRPCFSPAAWLPISSAAAPSFTPEALPAVTTPFSNSGRSLASAAMSDCGRGCSSSAITFGGVLRPVGTLTGRISSAKNPAWRAASNLACDAAAKVSAASRLMPNSRATLSPVCGMLSLPNRSMSFGFGKRAPMVLSYIVKSRL